MPSKLIVHSLQEVEEQERQQLASDASIKPKGKTKKGPRQAKLTSLSSAVQSVSRPSPFAEVIPPQIPEFKIPAEKKERKPKVAQAQPKGSGGLKQGKLGFKEAEMKTVSAFGDDSSDETPALSSKPVRKMKKEVVALSEDSDSEDEGMEVVEQEAPKPPRPVRKSAKVHYEDDDGSVSSDDDFSPVDEKKPNAAKSKDPPVKSSKPAGTKKSVKVISKSSQQSLLMWGGSAATKSQEEGEDSDVPVRPKKPPAKSKAAGQKRRFGIDDSEDDSIEAVGGRKPLKAKTASKRKMEKVDSSEDDTVAVKRKRPAPQKPAKKKVFTVHYRLCFFC